MERLTTQQRASLGAGLRRQYEQGDTVKVIATRVGRSYGFTHQILKDAGTVMRKPGGRR